MINRKPTMQYPVIIISDVNLLQNACSPSEQSRPKNAKKKIVAKKTIDTMVYPR